MANIAEVSNFDANVYEIATTDPVEGGTGGISNAQAVALANRTLWLKNKTIAIEAVDISQTANIDLLLKHMPKNRGGISGVDPGETTGSKTVFGNISAALVNSSEPSSGGDWNSTTYLVTMANTMTNTNYFVRASLESLGTITLDNDCLTPVIKKISATQFYLSIQALALGVQNLKVHLEVISLD